MNKLRLSVNHCILFSGISLVLISLFLLLYSTQKIFTIDSIYPEGFRSLKISILSGGIVLVLFGAVYGKLSQSSRTPGLSRLNVLFLALFLFSIAYIVPSGIDYKNLYTDNNQIFLLYALPASIAFISLILFLVPRIVQINIIILIIFSVILSTVIIPLFNISKKNMFAVTRNIKGNTIWIDKRNEITGTMPIPFSDVTITKKYHDGKLLYSCNYHIDEYSRRVVPFRENNQNDFLIFYGCSLTFGEGVNDNETIPYFVAKGLPQYHPYSYSCMGWGPAQFLAILENRDLQKEIPQKRGIVIHFHINDHTYRTAGNYRVATSFNRGYMPYYTRGDDNDVIRNQMFANGRPLKQFFYSLVYNTSIFHPVFLETTTFDKEDLELTADVLLKIKKLLIQKFNVERYIIVYWGFREEPQVMAPFLKERNIEFVSLYNEISVSDGQYVHSSDDRHFNVSGNQKISNAIIRYLHDTGVR